MALPIPQYPLGDECSVLFDNTLYTYNSQAFQSLALQEGAQWSLLPMGVAVTGGVCVKSTPTNNASATALYVVGGTSNSTGYPGLQKYTFADATWETVQPSVAVTQNRLYHSAVYLNSSDSILLFAGTQDGTRHLSSQTFTIQASSPYLVTAYQAIAPPAIKPMLLQWSQSQAMYLGGSETNTKTMIFNPSTTWVDSNTTFKSPFYNTSNIGGVIISGDDGSQNLYTFDPTTSPISVNRTILFDANGDPVQNAEPVLSRRSLDGSSLDEIKERSAGLQRRGNLTIADWPVYNDTFAPMATRSTYSICSDQSGLVVISGGNEKDLMSMFNARNNCWMNTTSQQVSNVVEGGSTSSSAASSASSNASAATTPTVPGKILGVVLGSIAGVAVIFLGILLLLRWRKKRRHYIDAGHQRRSSGLPDEKDGWDFEDKGLPQVSSARQIGYHEPQASQGSFSSMAMLMGRIGGHKRGGDKASGSLGSDSSSQLNKMYKTAISKPIPQERPAQAFISSTRDRKPLFSVEEKSTPSARPRGTSRGGRRGSTRRSSGWNRYWSGGSTLSVLGFGGSRRTTYEGSDRSSDSQYSNHRITHGSASVPPLKIGERPELNRVVSGSPTIANTASKFPLPRGMSGTIEKHESMSSLSSFNDDRHDAFSSGVPSSIHEPQSAWPSVEKQGWPGGRTYSNAYTESNYDRTLPRSTKFLASPPYQPASQPRNKPTSDMSWLNLGGVSRT